MPYFFTIVGVIIIINFYMLYARRKKRRDIYTNAKEERAASEKNLENVRRKLDREQAGYARHVELQNKMFEMYEQVRREAKDPRDDRSADTEAAADIGADTDQKTGSGTTADS